MAVDFEGSFAGRLMGGLSSTVDWGLSILRGSSFEPVYKLNIDIWIFTKNNK